MEALAAGDRPQTADRALHFAYYWCALPGVGRRHHQRQHHKFYSQLTCHFALIVSRCMCHIAWAFQVDHTCGVMPTVPCRYNFMPLARGSAVVGAMTVLAVFMAAGMPITASIPSVGLQSPRLRLQPGYTSGSVGKAVCVWCCTPGLTGYHQPDGGRQCPFVVCRATRRIGRPSSRSL